VRLRVRLDRPVCVEYAREIPDIHCRHAFVVEPFDQVSRQSVLGVISTPSTLSVQASNPLRAVPPVFEQRLQPGDFACRLAEPLEQVASFLEVLLSGCGRTGDEVVGTNIQSGFFQSQWLCQSRIVDSDWLKSPELARLFVVEQL